MKFFCVTPVFNGAGRIGRTIESIKNQTSLLSGRDTLRYIVADGGSTDGTLDEAAAAGGPGIEIRSQKDTGPYDALASALPLSDGEISVYQMAGDVLEPTAFETAGAIFAAHPEVKWLTGRATVRNARNEIVNSVLPNTFYRRLIRCGAYGTRLPVLQQEGTFWRTELQANVDFERLAKARIAGDYLLWCSFAAVADLYVVNSILGSFTLEPGQLCQAYGDGAYRQEIRDLRQPPGVLDKLLIAALKLRPRRLAPGRSAKRLFSYDFDAEEWVLGRAGS